MKQKETNHHCSVVEISGAGILIEGDSGSGKTSLALGLLDACISRKLSADLICDDQALLKNSDGNLLASAPDSISGLVELRGYGVRKMANKSECTIDLVARLVEDSEVDRMPEPMATKLSGVELPMIKLPRRHEEQSVRIVLAWLEDCGRLG